MTDEVDQPTVTDDKPLQCPECGKLLVRYDYREKWRCRSCNGVLVGHAQLAIELGELAEEVLGENADPDRIAARPCPVCAFAMSPYTVQSSPAHRIELDRCLNDEIVWFDGGEIGKVRDLVAATAPEEPPLFTRLVREVLEVQALEKALAAGAYDEIPAEVQQPIDPQEWQDRKLCPDGGCNGVLGPDGACHVCGKTPAPTVT